MNLEPFSFETSHLVSMDQLQREDVETIFKRAQELEANLFRIDKSKFSQKVLVSLFFEPSTRTRLSFEVAMLRLGGQVLKVETKDLSLSKGESLEDTFRVLGAYASVIVLRHPKEEALELACRCTLIPIISAGDGCNEHPTQALLDLYTIQKEKGTIDGLKVAVVGDLKHARTIHSLLKGLAKFNVDLLLVSPDELKTPKPLLKKLKEQRLKYRETSHIQDVIEDVDVLYIVMLQHHRIPDSHQVEELKKKYYTIDRKLIQQGKKDLIVLHPMVRRDELPPEVDDLPQAAYFRQVRNGVSIRMALLSLMLS
jgi:aspartate carbamoyltransferase catalytic subunit